jgi:hypothetical protein
MTLLDPEARYDARFRAIEERLSAIVRDLTIVKEQVKALPDWRWLVGATLTIIAVNLAVMSAYSISLMFAVNQLTTTLNQLATRVPPGVGS